MDESLRAFAWERAGGRCEYCRLHQDDYELLTFHVEHIIAKQHGGSDDADNLCLACSECNWPKGRIWLDCSAASCIRSSTRESRTGAATSAGKTLSWSAEPRQES